jgi:hypothetical protein
VVTWPEGRQYTIFVNVAFEAWAEGKAPGVSPMGNPLPGGLFDTQARSWGEYGWRRGVWNLLGRASGKAPLGFSYPRGTANGRSAALVAQAGFRWFADRFDDDRPYLEQTCGRPLMILPLTMEVNDLPQRTSASTSPRMPTWAAGARRAVLRERAAQDQGPRPVRRSLAHHSR